MRAEGFALVTGASRGIGRATALELARRGFDVVATMRDPSVGRELEREAQHRGARLRVERLDVTDPDSMRLPDGLRVLVNNAGLDGTNFPVEHTPVADWRRMFETNLFGLVEVTRRAIPRLRAAGGGVICNITSCSLLVPMPFFAVYRASKAAVGALGESLRTELAPFGIRVLEVMPGAIDTDMFAESSRTPEAVDCAGYRVMAERVGEARSQMSQMRNSVTSSEHAAAAIADAIVAEDGPLRVGCDGMSEGLLAAWRAASDEEMMVGTVAAFSAASAESGSDSA